MPAGHQVRPQKWSNVIDLFDDGTNSAIWGNYGEAPDRCLGVRWNGDDDDVIGYPNQGGNPLWYVEPDFVTRSILLELLCKAIANPKVGNPNNILTALKEL